MLKARKPALTCLSLVRKATIALPLGHHAGREGAVSFDLGPEFVVWRHRTTHLHTLGADVHETLSTGLTSVVVFTPMRPDQGRLLDGAEVGLRRRVGGLFVSTMKSVYNRTAVLRDARARALAEGLTRVVENYNTKFYHLPKQPGAQPTFGGGGRGRRRRHWASTPRAAPRARRRRLELLRAPRRHLPFRSSSVSILHRLGELSA